MSYTLSGSINTNGCLRSQTVGQLMSKCCQFRTTLKFASDDRDSVARSHRFCAQQAVNRLDELQLLEERMP
eukprot:1901510-Pleurochrysis_carterae.AAC.10